MQRFFLSISLMLIASLAHAAPIRLGSKDFTEQHLLSSMTKQYLVSKGFEVTTTTDLPSVIMRGALINKQLDMVWDYTGTALIVYHKLTEVNPKQSYDKVKELDIPNGLIWLKPAAMNNTYSFAMQRKRAEELGITTMSGMAKEFNQHKDWKLGLDIEFAGRPDGLAPMKEKYQLELERPQMKQMNSGLVYNAIRDGFVEVGLVYATDGRVKGFDFIILEDDQHFFPSYAATPVVEKSVLAANPGLEEALNTLSALLDNDTISTLNAKVDIEHQRIEKVAAQFLKDQGLLQGD
ncbi:glycine betaine ABC transporter substrate-binding protein [Janthinobacterium sp. B9-8]|uniref:glycine betaine ABC transporter substrate-binding protein n=1 Tax=Janthinobacterium sp. B9-8 TaxID=1236179 RepID=UPI00061D3AC2|nr:glycine betaine ABC transporter substrate-binding protein [Janthinobacterium sp. B9-8]AMC34829.1 glycine/betaine ABC transporter substrate-binding protein [Janthinobacterium sp. B9-8]